MKILLAHNRYQALGGEDAVMEAEKTLLQAHGHEVIEYRRSNEEILDYTLLAKATVPWRAVWARDSYRDLTVLLQRERPAVAHFHNTFLLISPAAYYACARYGVPVVQTLHNYRLLCSRGDFYRQGHVCEECVEHSLWRGLWYACYHDSRAHTAMVASFLAVHRWRRTWTQRVDCYIALTEFARQRFLAGGLPVDRVVVKPNFIHPDPGERTGTGRYALFIGRLAPQKGIATLLQAWRQLAGRIPLQIVGDGPLGTEVQEAVAGGGLAGVVWRGRLSHEETLALLKGARFLVFPSEWYEGFPMTVLEAFACGVPVICSRIGSLEEIVCPGQTGLHFEPGDARGLATQVEWAWDHGEEMATLGQAARREYESKYTAERNYPQLLSVYQRVLQSRG